MTNLISALIICLFIPVTTALKIMLWRLIDENND